MNVHLMLAALVMVILTTITTLGFACRLPVFDCSDTAAGGLVMR
jgi:hypothetical protein